MRTLRAREHTGEVEPDRLGSEHVRLPRARDTGWASEQREVVGSGEPLWSPPRWAWAVLTLVVLVAGLAWYGDHRWRVQEQQALSACQQRLEGASALADVRMGAMASYLRPALATTQGVQQLHLADLMAGPARRVLGEVELADQVCQDVSVRPWHFSLVAQRDAATAYSGALVTLVLAVAAQGRAYFHDHATFDRLRARAGID